MNIKEIIAQLLMEFNKLHQQHRFREALAPAEEIYRLTAQYYGEQSIETALCLNSFGVTLMYSQELESAARALEVALKILVLHPESDSAQIWACAHNLGHIYKLLQHSELAKDVYLETLRLMKQLVGVRHVLYSSALADLGQIKYELEHYDHAVLLWKKKLQIDMSISQNEADFADSHEKIAQILVSSSDETKLAEAFSHIEKSIFMRRHVSSGDRMIIADSLMILVQIAKQLKNEGAAFPAQRELAELARELFGEDSVEYARELNNLADIYFQVGQFLEAKTYYERSLNIARTALGEEDSTTTSIMNNLANACFRAGQLSEAEQLYSIVFNRRIKTHETDALEFRNALLDWIGFYNATGQADKISDLYQRIIDSESTKYGIVSAEALSWIEALVIFLSQSGDHQAAILRINQSIQLQKSNKSDRGKLTQTLETLAKLYWIMNDYSSAAATYWDELSIWELLLTDQPIQLADKSLEFAELFRVRGLMVQAKKFAERAFELYSAVQENSFEVGQTATTLGLIEQSIGDLSSAERFLRKALLIAEDFDEPQPHTAALRNLGIYYQEVGNYEYAQRLLIQSLDESIKWLGTDDHETFLCYSSLGNFYREIGRLNESEEVLLKALNLSLEAPPRSRAKALHDLGLTYREVGKINDAQSCFIQAIDLLAEDDPDCIHCFGSLGQLYSDIGEYSKAQIYLERELAANQKYYGPTSSRNAITLNNVASVYEKIGREGEAIEMYRRAIDLLQMESVPNQLLVGSTFNNIASLYLRIGALKTARSFIEESITSVSNTLGQHHLVAALFSNLGSLNWIEHRYEESIGNFLRAIEINIASRGKSHIDLINIYLNLAVSYSALGRYEEALEIIQQAADVDSIQLEKILRFAGERQLSIYLRQHLSIYHLYLSIAIRQNNVEHAFNYLLKRKNIAAEIFVAQRSLALQGQQSPFRIKYQKIDELKSRLGILTLRGVGDQEIKDIQNELDKLEDELSGQIQELGVLERLKTINSLAIMSALPNHTALLEFVKFESSDFIPKHEPPTLRYAVFIIIKDQPVRLFDIGDAKVIEEAVAAFRTSLTFDTEQRYSQDAQHWFTYSDETPSSSDSQITANPLELSDLIWRPIHALISQCSYFFIVPDGDLNRVPFELIQQPDGKILMDSYAISYLNAGRELPALGHPNPHRPGPSLVLAGPDFDSLREHVGTTDPSSARYRPVLNKFKSLPGALQEGIDVANLLDVKPLIGEDATTGRVREYQSPQVAHFATHAFFIPPDPKVFIKGVYDVITVVNIPGEGSMLVSGVPKVDVANSSFSLFPDVDNPLLRSGLALSGVNHWLEGVISQESAENGLLTALDITSLNFLGTNLVVLSACETGLGILNYAETVMGLRQAFMIAGAKSVIVSLWKIPDRATQELMVTFYQLAVNDGLPFAEALLQAKMKMRTKYQRSRNWGAFIFIGDPTIKYR